HLPPTASTGGNTLSTMPDVPETGTDQGVQSGGAPSRPDGRERTAATLTRELVGVPDVGRGEGRPPDAGATSGGDVDLMPLADPRTALSGAWSRKGQVLSIVTTGDRPAVLPIRYATPGEYDLEVRAEAGDGGLLMIG